MAKLVYSVSASLDGYIEDRKGGFDWSEPDEEVHGFVNDLLREIGTYLFGRRMYEVMAVWESMDLAGEPAVMKDYAEIWRATDKIVYSRTLEDVSTPRTRLERDFDARAVAELKAAAPKDLEVGGAALATEAFAAGLVDECRLFLVPVVVGGGKRALPDDMRIDLDLLEERRFDGGTVYLRYATTPRA